MRLAKGNWRIASATICPEQGHLFVGNSPVVFPDAATSGRLIRVQQTEGASGIDGLFSTAAGCAQRASGKPTLRLWAISPHPYDPNALALLVPFRAAGINCRNNKCAGSKFFVAVNNAAKLRAWKAFI